MKRLDIVHGIHGHRTLVRKGLCRVGSFVTPAGTAVVLTDLGERGRGGHRLAGRCLSQTPSSNGAFRSAVP